MPNRKPKPRKLTAALAQEKLAEIGRLAVRYTWAIRYTAHKKTWDNLVEAIDALPQPVIDAAMAEKGKAKR